MKKSLKPLKPYCSCKLLKELGYPQSAIKCKCKQRIRPVDKSDK